MNLRVIGANLVVSIKSFYRVKTAMFFTFAFPILLILVFGTIFKDREIETFKLYVQDLDRTETSAEIAKTLGNTGKFKITQVNPAIDAAQYAREKRLNLVLIIPQGYEKSYIQNLKYDDPNAFVTLT